MLIVTIKKQMYIEYFCVMYNYYLPCIILTIANEIDTVILIS